MANISSQEWCDLIFEGRNKAYGAYDLRKDSPKRHNIATLVVVVVAVAAFFLPGLIGDLIDKYAPEEEIIEMTTVTELSNLEEAEVKKNEELKPLVQAPPPPPLKSSIKFTAPVIKKDEEVSEEEEIKSQEELTESKVTISIADVQGNDEENGQDIADFKEAIKPVVEEDNQVLEVVEQMPTFPGGPKALMQYISENIKYPTIAQENGIQGRVVVRFVVKKDGSVGEVQILRGVDAALDKEAVRVVKSIPNFIPGKQNGHAVNVWFTLPVAFKLM